MRGVDLLIDLAGAEIALDEPGGGAAGHPLEIGDPERLTAAEERQRPWVTDRRRSREGLARAGCSFRPHPFAKANASAS